MALYLIQEICFVTTNLKRMQHYVIKLACQLNSVGVGTIEIMILCITKNIYFQRQKEKKTVYTCVIRLHV